MSQSIKQPKPNHIETSEMKKIIHDLNQMNKLIPNTKAVNHTQAPKLK